MEPPSLAPKSRKPKQARLKPEAYLPYQNRISEWYLVEKKSIKDIIQLLKLEFNFPVTQAQLVHQINEVWFWRKNLTVKDLDYIDHQKRKREVDGKRESRVKLFNIVQEEDHMARKKARRFISTEDRIRASQTALILNKTSPQQPPGLEIDTPTPRTGSEIMDMSPARSSYSGTPHGNTTRPTSNKKLLTGYSPAAALYQKLPSISLEGFLNAILIKSQGGPTPTSPLHLSPAALSPFLRISNLIIDNKPRNQPSNLIARNDAFFSPEELLDNLKSLVIQCGNRTIPAQSMRRSLDEFTGSDIPQRFFGILKLFFSTATPIINDFAAQTFYSAARTGQLELLKLFIELGIISSSKKSRWSRHSRIIGVTALQFSIEYRQGPVTFLLLRSGVDVNAQPISDLSQCVLKTAVEVQDLMLVEELISFGADDIVFVEIYDEDIARKDYLDELTDAKLGWAAELGEREREIEVDRDGLYSSFTALGAAVIMEDMSIFEVMLQHRVKRAENGKKPIPYDSTIHIMATEHSDLKYLHSILECQALQIDIDAMDINGTTALQHASKLDDDDKILLLTQFGARGSRDLVAATGESLELSSDEVESEEDSKEETVICQLALDDLLELLSEVQASTLLFPWSSYRQTLEPFRHLTLYATIHVPMFRKIRSLSVDNLYCKINIVSYNWSNHQLIRSFEVMSGNFPLSEMQASEHSVYFILNLLPKYEDTFNRIRVKMGVGPSSGAGKFDNLYSKTWLESSKCPTDLLDNLKSEIARSSDGSKVNIQALQWAREFSDDKVKREILDLYWDYLSKMTSIELSAMQAIAINCNYHDFLRTIMSHYHQIDKVSMLEATWNGDTTTFDMIVDLAQSANDFGTSGAYLVLITIYLNDLYKVVRLIDTGLIDLDQILDSGITFLEVVAKLGRLDIAQVLLNAGASHRLREAKEKAEESGNFTISEIINEYIRQIDLDTEMANTPNPPSPAFQDSGLELKGADDVPTELRPPDEPATPELDPNTPGMDGHDNAFTNPFGLPVYWPTQF